MGFSGRGADNRFNFARGPVPHRHFEAFARLEVPAQRGAPGGHRAAGRAEAGGVPGGEPQQGQGRGPSLGSLWVHVKHIPAQRGLLQEGNNLHAGDWEIGLFWGWICPSHMA